MGVGTERLCAGKERERYEDEEKYVRGGLWQGREREGGRTGGKQRQMRKREGRRERQLEREKEGEKDHEGRKEGSKTNGQKGDGWRWEWKGE